MSHTSELTLITGGGGFIGSFIVQHLVGAGRPVAVLEKDPGRCWRLTGVRDAVTLAQADLFDPPSVERVLQTLHPSAVIHLAWDGIVGPERDHEKQIKNLLGMQTLLDACARARVQTFIGMGSQAEYGVHNKQIDELAPSHPDSLYGLFKLTSGIMGKLAAKKFGFRYAWLRLFSTFGPGDDEKYFIPYIITSLLKKQSPELSSGLQRWDYLFVKDLPRLIELVMDCQQPFCDIYNFCSGQTVLLKEVAEKIHMLLGAPAELKFGARPDQKNGLTHLQGDEKKFKETFGWIGLTPMEEALKDTIQAYQHHQDHVASSAV